MVNYVTDTVRDTIRYFQPTAPTKEARQKELYTFDAIEGITAEQTTHCAGFTLVGSEALEAIGIEHYVGYMSGHWFLLVPYMKKGMQHMELVDMYKPHPLKRAGEAVPRDIAPITQDITDGLSQPGIDGFIESLRRGGSVSAKLDFHQFAATLDKGVSTWGDSDYRWLDPYDLQRVRRPDDDVSFVVTAYVPAEGKEIVERTTQFWVALARGETEESAYYLSRIAGRYPEVNARAPHDDIRSLVMALCVEGHYAQAGRAIDNYFGYAHSISRDPRLAAVEGDLWRYITRAGGETEAAGVRATEAYLTAASRTTEPGYRSMCLGKVATL